jgi:hypothetical protein
LLQRKSDSPQMHGLSVIWYESGGQLNWRLNR